MLGIRTPTRTSRDVEQRSPLEANGKDINVRRSIGKWEMGKVDPLPKPSSSPLEAGPSKNKPPKVKSNNRLAEARACLQKAKSNLGDARNLRGDIKVEVTRALDRLYSLVKEAEAEIKEDRGKEIGADAGNPEPPSENKIDQERIFTKIENNTRLLEEIKDEIKRNRAVYERTTYASMAAIPVIHQQQPTRTALHSIVISSKDEQETGEEVLTKIREAVNAKEGWVKVERIRKAKDRKIIMGCSTTEDRDKIRERVEKAHLKVEEVKNRDPLLTLKDVLTLNNDEEVIKAFRKQNKEIFNGINKDEDRITIKYKRKARNPHTNHITMSVSPVIWRRTLDEGAVRIDLQRIRAVDQSPLVQCTRCLAYGHGKRFCREPADLCSHCGEQHLSADCVGRIAGEAPSCKNCVRAKYTHVDHNTFDHECPVRKRWDVIARSTVSYC